jgi:hypothetical protein
MLNEEHRLWCTISVLRTIFTYGRGSHWHVARMGRRGMHTEYSVWLNEIIVYSDLHRTLHIIVWRNIIVLLRVPTVYSAALVCSALIAILPRVCALCLDKIVWSSELEGGKWKANIVYKMGGVSVLGYQTFWTNKRSTLKSEYQTLVQQNPEAAYS